MTIEEIGNILKKTNIPVAYRCFPERESPGLPFICYLDPYTNNFSADGCVYKKINHIQVELYTKNRSRNIEEKVENVLYDFYWEKETVYLEDEECFETIYELEV